MTRGADGPVWFVSVRSPYSWLAIHDARQRYERLWQESSLRVFFEPGDVTASVAQGGAADIPYRAMSRDKHLYILRDVRRLAAARGLEVTWPIDRSTCWEVASLAVLCVVDEDPAAARELVWQLAVERWQRGGDIGDPGVVASCLRRCGLDERLAWAWQDNVVIERGIEELAEVRRRGVFGVPYMVVGREPYWGLDRLDAAASHYATLPAVTKPAASAKTTVVPAQALSRTPALPQVPVLPDASALPKAATPLQVPVCAAASVDVDGHAGGCG